MTRFLLLLLTGLPLAACGGPAPSEGRAVSDAPEPMPRVVPADEAVSSAAIPTIDPAAMNEAEIENVLTLGPHCRFAYTIAGGPILAVGPPVEDGAVSGVTKINGLLVALQGQENTSLETLAEGGLYAADGLRMQVTPRPDEASRDVEGGRRVAADLIFELEQGLRVGYGGWWTCRAA